MIRVLKQGISADAAEDIDTEVRKTVEGIIDDIKARGDAAVRDLSERFDSYSPASFQLTEEEVEACVAHGFSPKHFATECMNRAIF